MTQTTSLDFGAPEFVDASLADRVRGLTGSEILKIAADIRELQASGQAVCNLTVGDFDPRQFPARSWVRTTNRCVGPCNWELRPSSR